MSVFKNYWKVWLRLNLLTGETDNDYVAEVSLVGKKSLRNADIARTIKDADCPCTGIAFGTVHPAGGNTVYERFGITEPTACDRV